MTRLIIIGAALGAALVLLITGLAPRRLTVAEALEAVRRPPPPPLAAAERARQLLTAPLRRRGLPRERTRRDLAVLERDPTRFLAAQLGLAALGLLAPSATVAALNLMGAGIGVVVPVWLGLLLAAGGYLVSELSVHEDAQARRLLMRHTLAALLDIVPTSLAAGAGVEQALTSTSQIASGWAAQRIRAALATARDTHEPISQALWELGERAGVVELVELAGSLRLAAGEGSRIREALTQRGEALAERLTADLEARAEAATERMSIPLMALTSLFLVALIYPALAAFQS
jgi:Flp pilus assembly protein TadB